MGWKDRKGEAQKGIKCKEKYLKKLADKEKGKNLE